MVFFLVLDVSSDRFNVGLADGEPGISALPVKLRVLGTFRLHPLGTALLDFFDDLLQSMVFRQRKQGMNVVLGAADNERGTIPLSENACLIRVKFFFEFFGNPGLSMLCAGDEVDQVLDKGLRHACRTPNSVALAGLRLLVVSLPRATLRG